MVTDNDALAERMRLIRNHAEDVVEQKGETDLCNMVGYNFRLGEIECAIGIEQLKKLKGLVASRQRIAERLDIGFKGLKGLRTPIVKPGCTHSYYVYPMVYDAKQTGVARARLHEALLAEGVPGVGAGYQNIHLLQMHQQKKAYGSTGFPWTSDICRREVDYRKGICPVAEELHDSSYLALGMCMLEFTDVDVDLVVEAFRKVWNNLGALK